MKKVFLDMGGNKGQGLREFINKYNIDNTWIVETFEPCKECNLVDELKDINYVNINNDAIWTHTGKVSFSIYDENLEGSSVERLMSEGYCNDETYDRYNENSHHCGYRKHDNMVEVDCIDISDLLNKYNENDFIVVKMDIEGSEYNVLRKSIKDGTIKKVNDIWIEWHHNHVKFENESTTNDLKNQISNLGININDWH
jgi:FkbM family methyltransferase